MYTQDDRALRRSDNITHLSRAAQEIETAAFDLAGDAHKTLIASLIRIAADLERTVQALSDSRPQH